MGQSEDQLKALMIGGLDGDAAAHAALLRALVPLMDGAERSESFVALTFTVGVVNIRAPLPG